MKHLAHNESALNPKIGIEGGRAKAANCGGWGQGGLKFVVCEMGNRCKTSYKLIRALIFPKVINSIV